MKLYRPRLVPQMIVAFAPMEKDLKSRKVRGFSGYKLPLGLTLLMTPYIGKPVPKFQIQKAFSESIRYIFGGAT